MSNPDPSAAEEQVALQDAAGPVSRLVSPVGFLVAAALVVAGWTGFNHLYAIIAGAVALTLWTLAMGFERLVQFEIRRSLLRFTLITLAMLAGHALIAALLYGLGVFAAWLVS